MLHTLFFGETQAYVLSVILFLILEMKSASSLHYCFSPHKPASQNATRNHSLGPLEPSRQIQTLFVRPRGCLHD